MALRIRANGQILCAAMHPPEEGDTYLHDGIISYRLTVELRALVTEPMFSEVGRGGHATHGEWWWRNEVPMDVILGTAGRRVMRGRLLEVCDGVPIYAKVRAEDQDPLALVAGRRGRLEAGGPVYEVDRIGQGAAYLHRVYDPPMIREFGDAAKRDEAVEALLAANRSNDGESARRLTQEALRAARACRRIEVSRGPAEPGISRSARFVERVQ